MRRALALGLIFLFAAGCIGFAQQLSGSWDLEIEIDPQQTHFSDSLSLYTVLKASYSIGSWTFGSATVLDNSGWIDQDFSTTGMLGAFTLTAATDFNPNATFGSLVATASVPLAGALLGLQFTLVNNDTFFTFTASGIAGDVNIDVSVGFGDDNDECDFPFSEASVLVKLPFCCVDVSSSMHMTCDGLENITFAAQNIAIPNLPWLSLNTQVSFSVQTKSLAITPVFDFGSGCIDVIVRVEPNNGLNFETLFIDGIRIDCNLGFASFTGLTYWRDVSKPGHLAGTEYFEVYSIKSLNDACCGPFTFEMSVFFLDAGLRLFDISRFDADFEIEFNSNFAFGMGFVFDVEAGLVLKWLMNFRVRL